MARSSEGVASSSSSTPPTAAAARPVGPETPTPATPTPSTAPLVDTGPHPSLRRARELQRTERFAEALAVLGDAPASVRDDPDALLLRAALLTNAGNVDEARRACATVLALDDMSAGAHYLMALCEERVGDVTEAVSHDNAAIYLDPSFAMPRLHLGLLTKRQGDLARARRTLQEALTLLAREDAARLLLFGGGFSRDALQTMCRAELAACGGGR
jgi:chemotaxis protein methyltransferase CheR